jgi:hypothetical protein
MALGGRSDGAVSTGVGMGDGVGGAGAQDGLDLEGGQTGVLGEDAGDQAGDVRCGEAVAGGGDGRAFEPGDLQVDAGAPNSTGGAGL